MDLEQRIKQLEWDLQTARETVLELLPEKVRTVLESFRKVSTPTDRMYWRETTADRVAELAEPLEGTGVVGTPRAYCPLCGGESSWQYEVGYAIPDGLKRHLTGWGNTYTCTVFEIATELAYAYWGRSRREVSEDYWEYVAEEQDKRRAVEVQYRIGPGEPPKLIDESLLLGELRPAEGLEATDRRLKSIGFTASEEERVIQYVLEFGDIVVYADPRKAESVVLRAYWSSAPAERRRVLGEFVLLDRWKNDLYAKIGVWVEKIRKEAKGPKAG